MMYGTNRLPATGYDNEHKFMKEIEEPAAGKKTRTDSTLEPVTYFGCSPNVFAELIHRVSASAVLHLTPVDHACAQACLKAKKAYLAVTMTSAHTEQLQQRIVQWLFEEMITEGSSWYDSELADALKKKAPPATTTKPPKAVPKKRSAPSAPNDADDDDSEQDHTAPVPTKKAKGGALAAIQAALSAGADE